MLDGSAPIYRQIAGQIRDDVVAGRLVEGDRVMSTNEYAVFHRINPATAAKAFQLLVEEGVLEKRRGLGMFVTEGARERLIDERRAAFEHEVVDPVVAEAALLAIPVGEVVAMVRARAATRKDAR